MKPIERLSITYKPLYLHVMPLMSNPVSSVMLMSRGNPHTDLGSVRAVRDAHDRRCPAAGATVAALDREGKCSRSHATHTRAHALARRSGMECLQRELSTPPRGRTALTLTTRKVGGWRSDILKADSHDRVQHTLSVVPAAGGFSRSSLPQLTTASSLCHSRTSSAATLD